MDIKRLRQVPLLSNTDPGILDQYISENKSFVRKYAKGMAVHCQHDVCTTLDVVLSGNLVAYSLLENGSAVTMFEFGENSLIGANLLFGENNAYPLNIYSFTACELLHVTKSAVVELLYDHDFVMNYIVSLSQNSQSMNRKITMLMQKTLRDNIMDYFRHQSIIQGSSNIHLPISKKELADYMGVQRPSLFRELKKLQDEGLIDISNRNIKVLK